MLDSARAFASFSIDDLPAAKNFYGNVLGLNVEEKPEGLSLALSGTNVFLYPKADHKPATFTVLNFQVADIDRAVTDLGRRGVRFERYDIPGLTMDAKNIARGARGPHIAWFKDPAGNVLSVLQER